MICADVILYVCEFLYDKTRVNVLCTNKYFYNTDIKQYVYTSLNTQCHTNAIMSLYDFNRCVDLEVDLLSGGHLELMIPPVKRLYLNISKVPYDGYDTIAIIKQELELLDINASLLNYGISLRPIDQLNNKRVVAASLFIDESKVKSINIKMDENYDIWFSQRFSVVSSITIDNKFWYSLVNGTPMIKVEKGSYWCQLAIDFMEKIVGEAVGYNVFFSKENSGTKLRWINLGHVFNNTPTIEWV